MKFIPIKSIKTTNHNKQLNSETEIDYLTGVSTRQGFTDFMNDEIETLGRKNAQVTVALIDLSGFKEINDYYGYDSGDEVLKVTAKRLTKLVQKDDFVARLCGNEFLISIVSEAPSSEIIQNLDRTLREAVYSPVGYKGKLLRVGASIGYAHYPKDGADIEDIIKVANKHKNNEKLNVNANANVVQLRA